MFKIISKPETLTKPYISVVIIAYKRKEYIKEAVYSSLDQTLDKHYYEVICIKNYLDDETDKFLKEQNVINIYSDEKLLGPKLGIGIQVASGEVISFLEDDDIFLPFKLKEVYSVFKQDNNIAFFRHGIIRAHNMGEVKPQLKSLELEISARKNFSVSDLDSESKLFQIQRKFDFGNNSSMSVRKSLYLPFLLDLKTNAMTDAYLFFLALLMDGKSILSFQKEPLSIWRVHDSWSQVSGDRTESEFLARNLQYSREIVAAYSDFINIISSRHADNPNTLFLICIMNTKIAGWHGRLKLAERQKCNMKDISSLLKIGIYLRNINIIFSVSLELLSLFVPDIAGRIFNWGLLKREFRDQMP